MRAIKKILNFIDKHIILIAWTVFFIGNNPITNSGDGVYLLYIFNISWVIVLLLLAMHLFIGLNLERMLKNVIALFVIFTVFVIFCLLLFFLVLYLLKDYTGIIRMYNVGNYISLLEIIVLFVCILVLKGLSELLFLFVRNVYACMYEKKLKTTLSILYTRKNDLKKVFSVALTLNVMFWILVIFFFQFVTIT